MSLRIVSIGIAMFFLCSCKPKDPVADGSGGEDFSGESSQTEVVSGGTVPDGSPSGEDVDPTDPQDPVESGSGGSTSRPDGSDNSSGTPDPTDPGGSTTPGGPVHVTSFGKLNTTDTTINSHEGDEGASSLELD